MSSLAITDALHGYEDNELKSPGWNHTLYAEYSKKGGATVVMARKTLTQVYRNQEKSCASS